MAPRNNKNYQTGTYAGIDNARQTALQDPSNSALHGDGMLSYYMDKFYHAARGHLVNKYHVGFWGPYVKEALRIMDRNAYADKYNMAAVKKFHGDPHFKAAFNQWADLFYSKQSKVLNMFWAAESVKVGESTAKHKDVSTIDTTKGMKYPLIMGDQGPKELTITIVDDPYMMWFQFFNALYNAQYSPLVLKARNTWQKINIAVDLYSEATTVQRSSTGEKATEKNPYITDIALNQMYEFNSCILMGAPQMDMSFKKDSPYTFQAKFRYPNAFQGTFKNQLRYLRDNTCDGTDVTATDEANNRLRRRFFEDSYSDLQKRQKQYIYETFNPNDYYKSYGQRYFSTKED